MGTTNGRGEQERISTKDAFPAEDDDDATEGETTEDEDSIVNAKKSPPTNTATRDAVLDGSISFREPSHPPVKPKIDNGAGGKADLDLDSTDGTASSPEQSVAPPPGRMKLGTIGGLAASSTRSSATPQPSEEGSTIKPRQKKLGTIGGVVASPEPVKTERLPSSPHRKLGMIGGSKRNEESRPETTLSTTERPADSSKELREVSKEPKKVSKEPDSPESPEQRANRKRRELQQELDSKAKAPVKKKRRF